MTFYTPHIDELYVGLECQNLTKEGNWEDLIITGVSINDESSHYRIKMLDPDDIIEEGFDLRYETAYYREFSKVLYSEEIPYVIKIRMAKKEGFPIIKVLKEDTIMVDSIMLKTKNEFKWLISKLV